MGGRELRITLVLAAFVMCCLFAGPAWAGYNADDGGGLMGIPMNAIGAGDDVDLSKCPQGARVVDMFLYAWSKGDFQGMYMLIDDASKADYSYEDAKFDFQFMDYKPYKISSLRRDGANFVFILSVGDWRDGDKETKKMIIDGKTFKIVMPSRGSFFKKSAESF